MPPPEYARGWAQVQEQAFRAFLRGWCERTLDRGAMVQGATLDGAARIAAGEYPEAVIDLEGRVAGTPPGKPLVNVLYRASHFPARAILRDACRAYIAQANVCAVLAHVAEALDAPVEDITVGCLLCDGSVVPFDVAAPSSQSESAAAGMLSEAFAAVGALGPPPRRSPPLIVNNEALGAAATHLPELAQSAVLIARPYDEVLTGDAALAERPDEGVWLIVERDLVSVEGYLSDYLCIAEPAAGRVDRWYAVNGVAWRVLSPANPVRAAAEQAQHALAGPEALLLGVLEGVMPPPWHASVAHTSIPCGSSGKGTTTRERFVAIHGLAEIFIATADAQAVVDAQQHRQNT